MKKWLLLLWPLIAFGQSIPNGTIIQGQVWTPAQWNAAWQAKADTNNPVITGQLTHQTAVSPSLSATAAPSSSCNWASITTAFTCDLSHLGLGIGLQSSNQAQGRPTTGYSITYGLSGVSVYRYQADGWNQDTNDNNGRTGGLAIESKVDNYSTNGGDLFSYHCDVGVFAAKSTATSFLASSAASCLAGSVNAFTNNVYLQGMGDIDLYDQGSFDVAGIGMTMNFKRTVATGNANNNWIWLNAQSAGGVPLDAEERFSGPVRLSFDLSQQTYPDQTLLIEPVLVSGGTNYQAGDIISAIGGTCPDQVMNIAVISVTGGVINPNPGGYAVERDGLCSSPPGNPVTFSNAHSGTGATFTLTWNGTANVAMAIPPNTYHFLNAINDKGFWNTGFPSTTLPGTTYFGYSSSLSAVNFVVNNTSVAQLGSGQFIVPVKFEPLAGINTPIMSVGGTAFTVASGTGTCATTGTLRAAVQAGDFKCTTAGTAASTVTLTLAAVLTAYTCWGRDVTTPTTVTQTGATSLTSVTLTLVSVTQNDQIQFGCLGY